MEFTDRWNKVDKIGKLKPSELTPQVLANCKYVLANEKMHKKNKGRATICWMCF